MVNYRYPLFGDIPTFEEGIVVSIPSELQQYMNNSLDLLEDHFYDPDRRRGFGLGNFTRHISPNLGTAGKLEWLLIRSGLVQTVIVKGVQNVVRARLTTIGAEALVDQYREERTNQDYETSQPTEQDEQAKIDRIRNTVTLLGNRTFIAVGGRLQES